MASNVEAKTFEDVPIDDPFFDSLRADYSEFPTWFERKLNEPVYVQYIDGKLSGFLYVKREVGEITDVNPPIPPGNHTKIGTLKVDAHGTRLGERLLKKAFDFAIVNNTEDIYLTTFEKHRPLIDMLEEYGFYERGEKASKNGVEKVYYKPLNAEAVTGSFGRITH